MSGLDVSVHTCLLVFLASNARRHPSSIKALLNMHTCVPSVFLASNARRHPSSIKALLNMHSSEYTASRYVGMYTHIHTQALLNMHTCAYTASRYIGMYTHTHTASRYIGWAGVASACFGLVPSRYSMLCISDIVTYSCCVGIIY